MSVITVFAAIIMFLLLIVAHEFGHFAAAKLCGVKVNDFSVGMGPQIWGKTKGDTEYSLRAFPIGGFCALEGEDGDSDDSRSFSKQRGIKKVFILVAGAFNNIVLAFLMLVLLFMYVGSPSTKLAEVSPDSPAAAAGILAGDRIVSIDRQECESWTDVTDRISGSDGPIVIELKRQGKLHEVEVLPTENEEGRKVIGITTKIVHSPATGFRYAWLTTVDFFHETVLFFGRLFRWQVQSDEVMGVVGIVDVISESASYGFVNIIYLMCIISLNLGMINLLPFPALDGGRIFFVILRGIFKGKISERAEAAIHTAGMILLMLLMIYLVINDTLRLFR